MASSLDRYEDDFKRLKDLGFKLELRMQFDLYPEEMREQMKNQLDSEESVEKIIKELPNFHKDCQKWYSESLAIIRQLIPDRIEDFKGLYEVPRARKEIKYGNYVIHDYLQGLRVTDSWGEVKVDATAALPQFRIQRNIFESSEQRFKSSLFDIVSLAQADMLDDEISAARLLLKNKFTRASGAIAGVVLESHLKTICENHSIKLSKQNPTISVLNDHLRDGSVIDVARWRFIQHLGDIRNLCDHKKEIDPTVEQVQDLIDGVDKIIKTVF